ncbi:conserved repeat domain protein [Coleofasciculus chthonoplastes PCC 7420]|uniref:Conserved repeat domain protein n=1 Tax=Coleofasciculus chthonoplastes PCC 7420 TaxID=118168 RepID=B4VZE2_9CYAN|nr:conserved repeat domain protein [Coleofasciculus chthonoplastes PCC 7420]
MKQRWIRFIAVAIYVANFVTFLAAPPPVLAQIAFPCDPTLYISQGIGAQDPTGLNRLITNVSPFRLEEIGPATARYNAIGFNVQDGFIYGIGPDLVNGAFPVFRIEQNGATTQIGSIPIAGTNIPEDTRFIAGDIDDSGNYYVYSPPNGVLARLTISANSVAFNSSTIVNGSPNFADIAFNPVDGNFYGYGRNSVSNGVGQIGFFPRVENLNNPLNVTFFGDQFASQDSFGAIFFDASGELFGYQNDDGSGDGVLYSLEVGINGSGAGQFRQRSVAPAVSQNDGASCAYAPVVQKTVSPTEVTAGDTVTYTYRFINRSSLDITQVTFTDRLPSGTAEPDGRTFLRIVNNAGLQINGDITGLDTNELTITGITVPRNSEPTLEIEVQIPQTLNLDLPGTFLNQALIEGTVGEQPPDRPGVPTTAVSDFPDSPEFPDPTPVTVNPNPVTLVPSKTVEPIDSNGNGAADPGEELRYTITIENTGTGTSTNTILTEDIPANTTYVPGSATLNGNPIADANGTLPFVSPNGGSVGNIAPGGTATVTFRVTINDPLPSGVTEINNTATVTSDEVKTPVSTDNPDTPDNPNDPNSPEDPTVVPIGGGTPPVPPEIYKSVRFLRDIDGNGVLNIGDDVEYKIIVSNPSDTRTINNVVVRDIVPIQVSILRDSSNPINIDAPDNSGFALAPTFPSTSFNGTGEPVQFTNAGNLPPSDSVTITYNAKILDGSSSPITNQGLANYAGDGGNPVRSDASDSTNPDEEGSGNNPGNPDPDGDVNQPTGGPDDPTILNFVSPVNPAGTKSVRLAEDVDGSGSISTGDILEYTITYTNTDPTDITNFEVTDEIADGLSFVSGSLDIDVTSGTTVTANPNYNGTTNTTLNQPPGTLASDGGQVVFTYRTEITAGPGTSIRNQAVANFEDNTGAGSVPTDAIQKPGDLPQTNNGDPNNPKFDDPTILTVEDPMTPTRPVANKSVRFLRDNDNSGSLTIGDDIQYTIIVRNPNPTRTLNNVVLSEILPIQVRILRDGSNPINVNAGFSLASSLPISSFNGTGSPIEFTNPGTLPPTGEVVLTFNARILPGAANPITNQGLVNFEGDGGNPVRTDASDTTNPRRPGSGNEPGNPDPVDTGGNVNQPNNSPTDPTILNFVSPVTPTGSKSVRLVVDADGNGSVTTGDTLEYTIIYTNPETNAPITNVLITDQIEADKVSFVPDSYNFRRVDGSGTAGNTTTVEANPSFNGTTDQNLSNPNNRGQLGTGGGQVMIMYSVRVTAGAGTQIQNQATAQSSGGSVDFSLTDALSGLGDDGTPSLPQINDDGEDLGNLPGTGDDEPTIVTVGSPGNPRLRLVKRITNITRDGVSISGIDFNSFNDDPANPDDDAAGWAQRPPVGIIQLGPENTLQSGDNVEYTIYFLSDGGTTVNGIQVCDAIPEGTTFISDSVSPGQGILLNQAGIDNPLTNALDADLGTFFGELDPVNTFCPNPNNPDGSVLVNVGNVSTISPDNIGFVRFRVRID